MFVISVENQQTRQASEVPESVPQSFIRTFNSQAECHNKIRSIHCFAERNQRHLKASSLNFVRNEHSLNSFRKVEISVTPHLKISTKWIIRSYLNSRFDARYQFDGNFAQSQRIQIKQHFYNLSKKSPIVLECSQSLSLGFLEDSSPTQGFLRPHTVTHVVFQRLRYSLFFFFFFNQNLYYSSSYPSVIMNISCLLWIYPASQAS